MPRSNRDPVMSVMRVFMASSSKTRDQIELHRTVGRQYRIRYRFPFAADFQMERNRIISELLEGEEDQTVLDLGCGTGVMIDTLAAGFRSVMGMDISLEMISAVETAPRVEGYPPVVLFLGDMESLPLKAGTIDRIVCRSALHHVDQEERVLRNLFQTLKPGGRIVVAEPVNDNPLFRLARWKVRHGKSYGKIHTIDRAFRTKELKGMLRAAGFEIDREVRYGFVAYPLCDNPDLVPVLKHGPFGRAVGAALRAFDRFLAVLPFIRQGSWYTILSARRPDGNGRVQ